MKPEIVVVVVLYQQLFSQSPTYEPLSKALSEKHIQLVIYDNSPQRQQNELFEKENTIYYHDPQNPGLAAAYNYALSQANERTRCIVTLDQDTRLVDDYFEILRKVAFTDECVAAVPMIFSGGRQVSPVYSNHYINRTAQAVEVDGTTAERIMAINSGVAWSVKFLKKIGGFNPAFSLDFLDHWLFWKVNQLEKMVEILPVRLEHDLSVLDYEKVTSNRY
ncbi:MAG: glycosyltransferase, partial [Enterococcus faecium]